MKRHCTLIRTLVAYAALSLLAVPTGHAQGSVWATAYYAGWMQGYSNNGHLPAQAIDYSAVTHIVHFSLVPNSNGTLNPDANSITLTNSLELVTRAHAAGKKVIISVGGWNSDVGFRGATGAVNRALFVTNLVTFMTTRGYDGIDIDWEVLQASDAIQYTAFIAALRTALNAVLPRPLLTAACGSQAGIFAQVHQHFDQINIMTYDMSGAWPGWVTWHNSPVYDGGFRFPSTGNPVPSINGEVDRYIAAGVPASKIGVGIDFYGYVWNGGSGTPTGGATEPRQGWTTAPTVQANVPYYTIMQNHYQPGYYQWDAAAEAAYLKIDNAGSTADKFISYDDETAVRKKFDYARAKGIGGLIVWELGGGYRPTMPAGQRDPLLQAVKAALNSGTPATPPAPVLAMPLNGATNVAVNPTLSWNSTSGAASYRLQVSTTSSFSTTLLDQSGITGTSAPVSGLSNATQYSWRVNATNTNGTGSWSSTFSFTTTAAPSADTTRPVVTITSPANATTVAGTITVTANASDNVGVAGVQFRLDGTNLGSELTAAPYSVPWNTALVQNGAHLVSAIARDAAGNTATTSITVNVSNSSGTTGNLIAYDDALQSPWANNSWSATVNFSSTEQVYSGTRSVKVTTNAWGGVSLHYGPWGSQGITPTQYQRLDFAAYAPSSGTRVTVFFENDLGQSFPQVTYGTVAVGRWVVISLPMSQLNPNGLVINRMSIQETSGMTKTFHVDDICLVGSAPVVPPPAPVLASPSTGATNVAVNPTLGWNGSTGATTYQLQVSTGSSFSTTILNQSNIAATSSQVSGLANDATYYWRVNASNAGGTGGWSTVSSFTTVDSVPAATGLAVYQESLQSPWMSTSWSTTATFTSTERPFEGSYSIKIVQGSWGALRLRSGSWGSPVAVNTDGFSTFEVAVYGGSTGLTLRVYFENDLRQSFPAVGNIEVAQNTWRVISIPISQLNPDNRIVHSVVITNASSVQRTYFVDNMRFMSASTIPNLMTGNVEQLQTPTSYTLSQNYPNPFNPSTTIAFSIPEQTEVTLRIYNLLGEEVATLASGVLPAGSYQRVWDAHGLASGFYIYRLTTSNYSETKKLMLTK